MEKVVAIMKLGNSGSTLRIWHFTVRKNISVQFSRSVVSDSLWSHDLQHAGPPCPSPTPGVHPNSCPLSPWCHPAISSSVIPFSSCPKSLPASESFPMSQLFAWGGQSIGVSALASFLPENTQDWSPLEWTSFLAVQGTLKSLLQHHSSKASILQRSAFFIVHLSRPYLTTGKTIALSRWTFDGKVMSLLFTMLSRLVIAFLWRSKHLLISWLPSPSEVILEPKKIKSLTVPIVSLSVCHEVMGCGGAIHCEAMMPWSSFPECWVLSRFFHSPVSPSSRGSLVSLHLVP